MRIPLPGELAERAERAILALLTGWTFDYIDRLGLQDRADFLQAHEARQKLNQPAGIKNGN